MQDWCSERQHTVFDMQLSAREQEGLKIEYKIQDLSVERLHKAVLDDHNNPVRIHPLGSNLIWPSCV
jgi:hypothetical protein